MTNENVIKWVWNGLMFLVGVAILYLLLDARADRKGKNISSKDTVIVLSTKPEVHNYQFTNPTVYKEKTIEYNTSHILTRQDSDAIVYDYLKERQYIDSTYNDTSKVVYNATVSKNSLTDIKFRHEYKPKIYTVTNNRYRNSLFFGAAGGWFQDKPTFGFYAGFETKKYGFGTLYDPLINPKGGYIVLSRRINFK